MRPEVAHKVMEVADMNVAVADQSQDAPGPFAPPMHTPTSVWMILFVSTLFVAIPICFFFHSRLKATVDGEEVEDADSDSAWRLSPGRALMSGCCFVLCVGLAVLVGVLGTASFCAVRETGAAAVLAESGNKVFTLDSMRVLPPTTLYPALREQMDEKWTHEASGYTYGTAGVHESPMLLYNGTKIEGNWEHVPAPVRGVFWMKGNGIPEILATLQNAEWFAEEKILVMPNFPFSWTWYGGESKPAGTSQFGNVYDQLDAKALAESMGEGNNTVALSFQTCPKGGVCEEGSEDFTFADLKSHAGGDLTGMSAMYRFMTWTMEEDKSVAPRYSKWYRRNRLICESVEFGSYWLTKIIDENGERIEPHYSEYVDYMGDAPQIIWTGFGEGNHLV